MESGRSRKGSARWATAKKNLVILVVIGYTTVEIIRVITEGKGRGLVSALVFVADF